MPATPPPNSPGGQKIETLLASRSLAPRVYEALRTLGYSLDDQTGANSPSGGIWLVDESRLQEVPTSELAQEARILVISSARQKPSTDPRVLAQTPRPARLSAVYAMIQNALEPTPRRNPRIRTKLAARCLRAERRSIGALLSLSEGGCLLRTSEPLRKGARLDLQFALPEYGLVSTSAECRYVRKGQAGLEFRAPATDIRQSIAHFVTLQLAENLAGSLT